MRKIVMAAVALGAALFGSGPAVAASPAIIGGQTATGHYSWIVDLGHDEADEGHGCGGGLIAPRWVVTAAHCIGHQFDHLRIGSNDRKTGGEIVTWDKTFTDGVEDLALIRLSADATSVPMKVASTMPSDGSDITLLGWGWESNTDHYSPRYLKQLDTTVLPSLRCVIGPDEVCVQTTSSASSCHGDSGTPALVNGEVVALTSRGTSLDCGTGPTIYTGIVSHMNWIDSVIEANS